MNRLIPMLPVKSMAASLNFYCGMLGFEVENRNDDWGWAMLRFDECRLMVDQSINRTRPCLATRSSICTLRMSSSITGKFVKTDWLCRNCTSPSMASRSFESAIRTEIDCGSDKARRLRANLALAANPAIAL